MRLVRRLFGARRPPPWATESTQEVQHVRTFNDSTAWAHADTGTLQTVTRALAQDRPYWVLASGEVAFPGDAVATDLAPDSQGVIVGVGESPNLARVRLTQGPAAGDVRLCTPGEMLRRLNR